MQGGWFGWDGGQWKEVPSRGEGGMDGLGAVHQNATSLHSPCGPPNFRESDKDIRSNR